MRTTVVIPAFNEHRTIRDVVSRTLEQGVDVIVVDDGSSDDTAGQLKGLELELLQNERNLGKGASLRRGMQRALTAGADRVITLDADGQHAPEDIPQLMAEAERRMGCVIIGARLRDTHKAPKARLFANRFADFWVSWAAGCAIRDTQSGFRLYPAAALSLIPERLGGGFVFESEILIELARAGSSFATVPIASCYPEDARPSHFRPVRDIARIVRMVAWKLICRGMYPQGLARVLLANRADNP